MTPHSSKKICLVSFSLAMALLATAGSNTAFGAEPFELHFIDHRFTPNALTVPAGQLCEIVVINSSSETIEFESFKLNRERVVGPGETITVHLPALSPGVYDFYDDFHQDVPQGTIVAR